MNSAEENIKPYLPRALRGAVDFSNGEVTCGWDGRSSLGRYEDGDDHISVWIGGKQEYITAVAAAMHITRRAFIDDILPSLARVLDGVYRFNVRKGTARLKDSGLGPFLDLRAHDDYDDAVEAGALVLADQTIRLAAADAVRRLGPGIVERTDAGRTVITTTRGTVCMSSEVTNGDGSVQAVVDAPRWNGVVRIEPGDTLPAYVIRDLIGPGEEKN